MHQQILLGYFEHTPRHRDEYDERFVHNASLEAFVEITAVPPRRRRKFIAALGNRLNRQQPSFVTTICHYEELDWLVLDMTPASLAGDFSTEDRRSLRKYLAELRAFAAPHGARILRWSKRRKTSLPIPDFGNTVHFYSLGLMEILCKRARTYDEELYLAISYDSEAVRRIRRAYGKHPTGTIAHLSRVAQESDFGRTMTDVLADCVRPDRWERRALLALTDIAGVKEHLEQAWRLDAERTLEFVALASPRFQRSADRALGAAFRRARRKALSPQREQGTRAVQKKPAPGSGRARGRQATRL